MAVTKSSAGTAAKLTPISMSAPTIIVSATRALPKRFRLPSLKPSALPHVYAFYELQYLLINQVQAQSGDDLTKAIVAAGVHVTINPAYGSWDAANGRVNGATTPSFLTRLPDYVVPTAPAPSTSAAN